MSISPSRKRIYNDRRWKLARRLALEAANYQCQVQLPGCTTVATQGDHRIALEDGGAPFDLRNIDACCRHCNVAKENNTRLDRGQPMHNSRDW